MSSPTSRSGLSRRAQRLVDSPPVAPYITAHLERAREVWDDTQQPGGYIPLCIAENKRRAQSLIDCLDRYRGIPTDVLGYDAMIGNLEFRENLASFLARTFLGRPVAPESLAVLAGAGSVLELLFHTIADPGDGVLVPTPSYAGFWADLETRNELSIMRVDTSSTDGFVLTTDHLDAAMARADRPVRALLFTNPDNPLGRVASAESIDRVLRWAEAKEIHVVFDEIYALSVFGPRPFVSAAAVRANLGDHVHIVWAFSKDFGASGLRCGILVSENAEVLSAVDQIAYWAACSGHTQHLLSRFVADGEVVDRYVRETRLDLAETYAAVTEFLQAARIPFLPAEAAFFLLCDLRKFLDEATFEGEDRLWRKLIEETNVNLTPGSACRIAEPGFFRLCYAGVDLRTVEIGIERVGRCVHG